MRFGWQGFLFSHPEDWSPVTLQGRWESGYASLEAPDLKAHLRWEKAVGSDLNLPLERYFDRLRKDARKRRAAFDAHVEPDGNGLLYRIQKPIPARGRLFDAGSRRVFFECVGAGRKLVQGFRDAVDSFEVHEARPIWGLYGLEVAIPRGPRLIRAELLAGRTALHFRSLGVDVQVERWGLAQELLVKIPLADWARAKLKWPRAQVHETERGLELSTFGFPTHRALVQVQAERNQIVWVRSRTIRAQWRPTWDWLEFSPASPDEDRS